MDILKADFIKGFIRLTEDGFRKGWHERNGGNLSYRITIEEIAFMAENTLLINSQVQAMQPVLLEKHYFRKHGKNAYYGQG